MKYLWIILFLFFGTLAFAQQEPAHDDPLGVGHTHQGDVGQFYQTWKRPLMRDGQGNRYSSCCGGQDCRPILAVRKHRGGFMDPPPGGLWENSLAQVPAQWEVYIENLSGGQAWYPVPDVLWEDAQVDPRESPDERGHVCVTYSGFVLCAVRASGQ